jgi:hypothetical protein
MQYSLLVAQVLAENPNDFPTMAAQTTNKAWVCFTSVLYRKLTVAFGKSDLEEHCQVMTDLENMESINDTAYLHLRNIL